jgi:TldD protein
MTDLLARLTTRIRVPWVSILRPGTTDASTSCSILSSRSVSHPKKCHPKNPHVWGSTNNDSCSWAKRGEGSAVRNLLIRPYRGALSLRSRVPHPSSAWVGNNKPDPARIVLQVFLTTLLALFFANPLFAQSTRADGVPTDRSTSVGRTEAQKDKILAAMLTELDRSVAQLELPGFQKPFFIQYRIEDVDDFEIRATFGATQGISRNRGRIARVTVLVGDYKTDSSGGRGDGSVEMASIDDDPIALRTALWSASDQAYKNALAAYAQKQAALKQVETTPQADDFSREKPLVSLAAPESLKVDEPAWQSRVAHDSGLFRTEASVQSLAHDIQYSNAAFHARVTVTRLIDSEGTIVRKSASSFQETFAIGTQADDGMHLDRSFSTSGVTLADLDPAPAFTQHAIELIASLAELRKAPLVEEEYHGPVLLSADAGTDTLRHLLSAGVLATRPRLGTEARTNGAFASSFHARILPDFLDITDDPSLKTWNGKNLVGAYDIDDEGVSAQSVEVVAAGRLENYLIGRQPVRDFAQSNGHGRAAISGPARPSIAVLKITAKEGLSEDDLNKKLLDIAKDRDLKSVYYVATFGGPLVPRLLYRINQDGSRQLVRGARLSDLDQRTLRSSVEAAGKDLWIGNFAGEIPETVLAPALLLDDITIRRANEKNDKLPFYPPPD